MLTRFRMVNYRSHGDSTIHLSPITVLVGPAGAGKSNIFRALVLLQNSLRFTLEELFPTGLHEFQWVRSRWANVTDPITLEVEITGMQEFAGETAAYSLVIGEAPKGLYIVSEELKRRGPDSTDWRWVFQRKHKPAQMGEFGWVDPHEPTLLHRVWKRTGLDTKAEGVVFAFVVAEALWEFGYYHLEVSALKELGTGEPTKRIGYRGQRLPDFMAWAKAEPDGRVFETILAKLRELLPEVRDILVTRVNADQQGLAVQCEGHHGYITARDLSDGTLLTLGLLAIALGPQRPKLLCLEEPETGLHPRRLRWLFDHLVELAYPVAGEKRAQVLVATHSPDLVNLFSDRPESIVVVESDKGHSRVRALPEILSQIHQPEDAGISIGHAWATGLYEGL